MRYFNFPLAAIRRIAANLLLLLLIAPTALKAQTTGRRCHPTQRLQRPSKTRHHPRHRPVPRRLPRPLPRRLQGPRLQSLSHKGAYFPDCYYDYANTKTAPGHATIGTGAYSDGHGIANNDWWDLSRNTKRPITSVEDERYSLGRRSAHQQAPRPAPRRATSAPRPSATSCASPPTASRSSSASRSKTAPRSSPPARPPTPPTGSTRPSGDFITSTYYMGQLPAWAAAFNASGRAAQAAQEATVFANKYGLKESTTAARTSTASSAALPPPTPTNSTSPAPSSPGEQLGRHPVTDMLTISLSANDILGHAVGPDCARPARDGRLARHATSPASSPGSTPTSTEASPTSGSPSPPTTASRPSPPTPPHSA